MNSQEYRQFLQDCLEDYDNYLRECVNMLNAQVDKISDMKPEEKHRYLQECRLKFIDACVTAYEEDSALDDHIDG